MLPLLEPLFGERDRGARSDLTGAATLPAVCGRFVAASPRDVLVDWFGIEEVDGELPPSWNVAPSDDVWTVTGNHSRRLLGVTAWGLPGGDGGPRRINARAETLADRPAFREAFQRRRCLVPADGFYEWET